MKDWFGILIFVAIAIANIMIEQKRQQKKKAARSASPVPVSAPVRKRVPVQRHEPADYEQPVEEDSSLQEALQSLFENSRMESRKEVPPELPLESEAQPLRPLMIAQTASNPAPASPILPSVSEKNSAKWLSRSDFRSRASLRRAVIMSELLAKPRGLQ